MGKKTHRLNLQLTDQFNSVAELDSRCENRYVCVSKDLYDTYLRLYFLSLRLCDKLEQVINDGEHQLCMEEGLSDHWGLPQPDFMADDVRRLKSFLNDLDPFTCRHHPNNKNVTVPARLAVGMHHLLQIDILMVGKLFDMFRTTDYLDYHRELKEKGIKYAGPTSLAEIVGTYMMMAHTHSKTKRYLEKRNIPEDWPKLVMA